MMFRITLTQICVLAARGDPKNPCFVVLSVRLVSSRNALISCSACNSIGEIGRNGPLPLPAGVEAMEQGTVRRDFRVSS